MNDEKRSSRKGLYFLLGIAAGAAAGWYLNSENGRRFRKRSADTISDWRETAASNAQQLVEKSRDYADDLASRLDEYANNAHEMSEEIMSSQN